MSIVNALRGFASCDARWVLQQSRCVGVVTPFSRARQPGAAPVVRQNVVFELAKAKDDARSLCVQAHDAAVAQQKHQAVQALLLAMKESTPRWSDIRPIADAPLGSPPRTLLQRFAVAGFHTPLKTLLEFGVSVQRKDEDGKTALHLAAEQNQLRIVKLLLKFGHAQADVRDAQGRTPLHYAAVGNFKEISLMLMNYGADPQALDANEKAAVDVVKKDEKGNALQNMMQASVAKRKKGASKLREVYCEKTKRMGAKLPADLDAPKLVMTSVGYCPVGADGKVVQLKRGIRYAKRRRGPSSPKCYVNWYAPRG